MQPLMRPIMPILAFAALYAGPAVAAPTVVAVLPVEAQRGEQMGLQVDAAIQTAVERRPKLKLNALAMRLEEARMTFSCFDESEACMVQVGQIGGAQELIWGHLRRTDGGGWELELARLDIGLSTLLRKEKVRVGAGPNATEGLAAVARAFVAGDPMPGAPLARLRISSEPSGARVLVDGHQVARTPADVEVDRGQHRVQIEADGLPPVTREVMAGEQPITLHVRLGADSIEAPAHAGGSKPDSEALPTSFWVGVGSGAVAVAAAATAGILGLRVLSLEEEAQESATKRAEVEAEFDKLKLGTNVAWIVCGTATAVSAYFFFVHDELTATLAPTPEGGGAFVLGGSF